MCKYEYLFKQNFIIFYLKYDINYEIKVCLFHWYYLPTMALKITIKSLMNFIGLLIVLGPANDKIRKGKQDNLRIVYYAVLLDMV